jgi:hypothetical protein
MYNLFAEATTGCTLNGQPISCSDLVHKAKPFIGLGIGIFAALLILAIACFVFWFVMLMHAINHDSPDRTLWIVVLGVAFLAGLGFIAAIIYFFAEKSNAERVGAVSPQQPIMPPQTPTPPVPPVANNPG